MDCDASAQITICMKMKCFVDCIWVSFAEATAVAIHWQDDLGHFNTGGARKKLLIKWTNINHLFGQLPSLSLSKYVCNIVWHFHLFALHFLHFIIVIVAGVAVTDPIGSRLVNVKFAASYFASVYTSNWMQCDPYRLTVHLSCCDIGYFLGSLKLQFPKIDCQTLDTFNGHAT